VSKRILLIHAMPVSIPPIRDVFTEAWPEAEISNLLAQFSMARARVRVPVLTSPAAAVARLKAMLTDGENGMRNEGIDHE
jgi:hypothetical protein